MFFKNSPPILCTSHGGDLFGLQGKLFKKLKQWVLKRSTALTVVSQAMRQTALSLGAEANKIEVISMGVDLKNQFIPTLTTKNANTLLFVGRLVEKKGLDYLLAALPILIKQHPNISLTIAGSGPDELKLKQQVTDLNLNQYVKFLGAVENEQLPALYQSSEIVVFPSIIAADGDREGFGLVLVEALGCESAVIASDLPAMQDILTDNKNALIFEQKNSQQLAEKVNQLLINPQLRASLGKQGRHDMLERYDWEIITKRYSNLMQHIMSK
jgi:glycosyltransferase involved in cell wall biosynthesis